MRIKAYKYLGHWISEDLYDDIDIDIYIYIYIYIYI